MPTPAGATTYDRLYSAFGGGLLTVDQLNGLAGEIDFAIASSVAKSGDVMSGALSIGGGSAPITIGSGSIAAASGQDMTISLGGNAHKLTLAGTGGTGTIGVITAGSSGHTIDFSNGVNATPPLLKTTFQQVGGNIAFSGAYSASKSPLSMQFSPSGTVTPSSGSWQFMQWTTPSDTVDVGAGNTVAFLDVEMHAGGHTGNRAGIKIAQTQTAASLSHGCIYQGGQASADCSFNEGGSGLTAATAAGANYAWDEYARLHAGATNFYVNKAKEIDLLIETGASALKNIGMDVVLLSGHAVQGTYHDYAYGVGRQGGATAGFKSAIQFGSFDGVDPFDASATIVRWAMSGTASPTVLNGVDLRVGNITGNAWTSSNAIIKGGSGTAYFGGTAQIAATANGASLDVSLQVGSFSSISNGGSNHVVGDYFIDNADLPGIWKATAVSSGVVTAISLVNSSKPYSASGPATLTLTNLNPDRAGTCTINATWTTPNRLSLQPNGGTLQTGSGTWSANGTTAVSVTSVAPAGAHATIQEWLTVVNASGTVRYIPAF